MIEIKLRRKTTGAEIIEEMKSSYGSIHKLERLVERNPNDAKTYYDLDDWNYFKDNLDEVVEENDILIRDDFTFDKIEINMLNLIKNESPKNLSELARLSGKNISNILPKINNLEKNGLIELKDGNKNSKIPLLTYDEIVIEI